MSEWILGPLTAIVASLYATVALALSTVDIGAGITLLVGGGVVAEVLRGFTNRKSMSANTAKTLTDATVVLIAPLQQRIIELTEQIVAGAAQASEKMAEVVAECEAYRVQLDEAQRLITTMRRELDEAHRELEHLRARVQAREKVLDSRETAADRRDAEAEPTDGDSPRT